MFSIKLILISFLCILILCVLYVLIIKKEPDTPEGVYAKLSRKSKKIILGFTYAKRGELYENYRIPISNTNFELVKSLDEYPINSDGTFYMSNRNTHGELTENEHGFSISGVGIEFNCPSQWDYKNGKCQLTSLCQDDDNNIYRGIDYYYFTENVLQNYAASGNKFTIQPRFHERLYMHCKQGTENTELKVCASNELFRQEIKIDGNTTNACTPYDICNDKIDNVKHQFQIYEGEDPLSLTQYYICRNGKSYLETCPTNTFFNNNQSACTTKFECGSNEFTTMKINDNSYMICKNNVSRIINCNNTTVFFNETSNFFECLDRSCNPNKTIIFKNLPHIRYPIGYDYCINNTKTTGRCIDTMGQITGDLIQQRLSYRTDKYFINIPVDIPLYIYDENVEFDNCVKTVSDNGDYSILMPYFTNYIVKASFNAGLPSIPYNIKTKEIDYSNYSEFENLPLLDEGTFVYGNAGTLINKYSFDFVNNKIKYSADYSIGYAPFISAISSIRQLMYIDEVIQRSMLYNLVGDVDGVPYKIIYINDDIFENNAVRNNLYQGFIGNTVEENVQPWNTYTQQFTSIDRAHADFLLDELPFDESYIFQYKIVEIEIDGVSHKPSDNYTTPLNIELNNNVKLFMGVWTMYGLIQIQCYANDNVFILWTDQNIYNKPQFILTHKTLPNIDTIDNKFPTLSPRYYSVVTPLVNGLFHYRHAPICLQNVNNIKITHPSDAVTFPLETIFQVQHNKYYKYYDENENEALTMGEETLFYNPTPKKSRRRKIIK